MGETRLTARQLAENFNKSTRQNLQGSAKKTVTSPFSTVEFEIPKNRYLTAPWVRVHGKINVKHANGTALAVDDLAPYRLFRKVALDFNNGFSPYSISGEGLAVLNMIQPKANIMLTESGYCSHPTSFTSSSGGTDNVFDFTLRLPVTLNERDMVGIMQMQTADMTANLKFDVGTPNDMFPNLTDGYTLELKELSIMPTLETFSIPANPNARPDISILKICTDRTERLVGAGEQQIKLTCGQIYRKIALIVEDEEGNPVDAEWFKSNIQLVFNEIDIPYSMSADFLRAKNAYDLGVNVPAGLFILDFSNQGFSNFGSSRDMIDSSGLTEFWIKFTSETKGKVKLVTECLSRLV